MYGDFLLLEQPGRPAKQAKKLPIGETGGRSEAWLRDLLLEHPEVLPIADIDPSFGPLLPLCRELRTEAGPLDLAFVNPSGRLTLVECKLWRNPEARRKVVAQVLDYARALARWTYSDLQRQVSAATGRRGNVPFEVVKGAVPNRVENHFIDAVTQTMRSGRFLLLIAGDGIREDVGALAEMINRNAALGFSLGLVEVALYELAGDNEPAEGTSFTSGILVQPRVVAKTQLIERNVVLLRDGDPDARLGVVTDERDSKGAPLGSASNDGGARGGVGQTPKQAAYRLWWQPVLDMTFDDPDQEPPKLHFPNNVRAALPWPGTWVTAYESRGTVGVFLAGNQGPLQDAWKWLEPDLDAILAELPEGTVIRDDSTAGDVGIATKRGPSELVDDSARREWLKATINAYVNALRPRLKRAMEEI